MQCSVDATACPDVRQLARVLLHVGPGHADTEPVGKVEPPVRVEREVVLADLIILRLVGVEVVLPRELGRTDVAVQGGTDAHGELDCLLVDDRQRAWQPQAGGTDVHVRLVTERVATAAEQLGGGLQLAVHLEPDDHLPVSTHDSDAPASSALVGA